jgi:hypothetical protein
MPVKRSASIESPIVKRRRHTSSFDDAEDRWADWPAPRNAMLAARRFLTDIVENQHSVLIVPDKDADGLSGRSALDRSPSTDHTQLAPCFIAF